MKRLMMALVLSLSSVALAAPFNYIDTTVGGPIWNRPLSGIPPTGLSGVGTAVPYHVFEFTVDTSGAYDFLSLGAIPVDWDNFLVLYAGPFNPATPLVNAIVANDDFPSIGRSGFNGVALTAGTQYFLVTTGLANNDAGAFSNVIDGVGNVVPGQVPEPGTIALLGTSLVVGSAVAWRRRKREERPEAARL
jgi:hypothetical protein